jgi:hypothetical protein
MNKFVRSVRTIANHGANAHSVLRGVAPTNQGLRLQILEQQAKGGLGPIKGRFVILATGDNKHADALSGLVGEVTDAQEVLRLIREGSPSCVSVVNTNILALEEDVRCPATA